MEGKGREGKGFEWLRFSLFVYKVRGGKIWRDFLPQFVFHRVSEEEKIDENVVSLNGDVLLWFK